MADGVGAGGPQGQLPRKELTRVGAWVEPLVWSLSVMRDKEGRRR
jgi:hypothetical protein